MAELILHHYPMSPFAEKLRLILGYKQLPWRSVLIPPVMPKPDVVALTGGNRKTPVLLIGADIYCDTALIARVPAEALKAFAADRAALRGGAPRPTLADGTDQLKAHLAAINAPLVGAMCGPCLFGATPGITDSSVAHGLWFIRRAQPVAQVFDNYAAIGPWLARVQAIGHHDATEMRSSEALAVAASAKGHAPVTVASGLGFESGQPVTVAATDYCGDPVAGSLVGLSDVEVVVRRCGRPRLPRPHRQYRVDGRAGEPAQHGRLQRQQARGRGAQRDLAPGPGAGQ